MALYNDLVPRDLTCGTLCISPIPSQFAYLKISDRVVQELFLKFKERCSKSDIELPPFFKDNSPFDNPVGAHVSIVNSYEFSKDSHVSATLKDLEGTTFPFECDAIEKRVPKHWKQMKKIWVCTLKSRALDCIRKTFLHDFDKDEQFHFTFAVKKQTIKPVNRSPSPAFSELFASRHIVQDDSKAMSSMGPFNLRGLFAGDAIFRMNHGFNVIPDPEESHFSDLRFATLTPIHLPPSRTFKTPQEREVDDFDNLHNAEPISDDHRIDNYFNSIFQELKKIEEENNRRAFLSREFIPVNLTIPELQEEPEVDHFPYQMDRATIAIVTAEDDTDAVKTLSQFHYAKEIDTYHVTLAHRRGFRNTVNMLIRLAGFTKSEDAQNIYLKEGNRTVLWLDKTKISSSNDEVINIILNAFNEEHVFGMLFEGDKTYKFNRVHLEYAKEKGYINLCLCLQDRLNYEAMYENDDDITESEYDDFEVPLRNRRIKQDDIATSKIRGRFNDIGTLRKIKRLSKDKFNVHHAMLARKQDLPETEKYIKKALV